MGAALQGRLAPLALTHFVSGIFGHHGAGRELPGDRTGPCAKCGMKRTRDDLYAAWLAVPPDAFDGELLIPSAMLPGMVQPVSFRVRIAWTPK